MSTLHVRNVPPDIYEALRERARRNDSSISTEVIGLLSGALRNDRPELRKLLDEIEANRPVSRRGTPDAATIIRAERAAR